MFPSLPPSLLPARTDPDAGLVRGLAPLTGILTLDGELPVEHLMPGDRIITRGTGIARLVRVERFETVAALVRIAAGSLGHTRPGRDTVVGPGTGVLIRDWRARALWGQAEAVVPAARLVDDRFVRREDEAPVTLCLPVFEGGHVIYADGLEIGLAPAHA
ncbi:MAG: Hint domain-containing protein [Rubellimicrobium sp.]|nr:Hint domain-containing protein [Rubellimicrobium sp.]